MTARRDESFLDKIGTMGKKQKKKEIEDLTEEGRQAINAPPTSIAIDMGPEAYQLEEGRERSMIEKYSKDQPKVQELIHIFLDWINNELVDQRILVRDIEEDLYDGQILQKLVEKLSDKKINHPEVTQSEMGQKQRLKMVLEEINNSMGYPSSWANQRWSVDSIHSKNLVAILRLLVAMARHYNAGIRLPENVSLTVVIVRKMNGMLQHRREAEQITEAEEMIGYSNERDAFDTLFECAPEKLQLVRESLTTFINNQLNKLNLQITDLDTQMEDGVYLVLLMGLLEECFVPLYHFHLTPNTYEHKVSNVQLSFELMQDAGLPKPNARPEDIVNRDLKATLRILYSLFSKYKEVSM